MKVHGKNGQVHLGAAVVAEVTEFTVETSVALADATTMGDDWETHLQGVKKWSGSLSCFYDAADATGQVLLIEGASITPELYPDGAAVGKKYFTGDATVTSFNLSASKDGIVTASVQFSGNGPITRDTVV